jgi:hypothetical protein
MDWQKWTKGLPFKPEVVQISVATSIDNYSTAGRLMAVWAWVDENSEDGCNVFGVTSVTVSALLDRISGVTGFSIAMQNAGWLVVHEDHIEFPNGNRHNGETAKKRCKTSERVAKHRAAKCNDNVTPKALPDKIREDKNTNTPLPPVEKPKRGVPYNPNPMFGGALPPSLNTPEFQEAWKQWQEHLRQKGSDLTTLQARGLLGECEAMGASRAIAAILHSIASGSKGSIFEARPEGQPAKKAFVRTPDHVVKGPM